jgi:hypothetical protein
MYVFLPAYINGKPVTELDFDNFSKSGRSYRGSRIDASNHFYKGRGDMVINYLQMR